MTRRPLTSTHAFTTTELVVGMMLSIVAMVVAFEFLRGGSDEASRAISERTVSRSVTRTLEQLGSDFRRVQSPDLDRALAWDEMRDRITTPVTADFDPRELVTAQPRQVVFRADVMDDAGVECVEYAAVDGHLSRIVRTGAGAAWRSCTGAVIANERFVPLAPGSGPIFSYGTLENPSATLTGDPDTCTRAEHAAIDPGSDAGRLDLQQVTQVTVDLRAHVTRTENSASAVAHGVVTMRSRTGGAYLQALGCAV